MYLGCEFFITELHALAYFTHNVTLLLLNCGEVCKHTYFLTIFPKVYTDLCAADLNTLKKVSVVYKHLPIEERDNELGKEIIKRLFLDAAECMKYQCEREHDFSKSEARATQLDKLALNQGYHQIF